MRGLALIAGAIMLAACTGNTIEPAKTFIEQVDYAVAAIDGLIQNAIAQEKAGSITALQAKKVVDATEPVLDGLDKARGFYAFSKSAECAAASDATTVKDCSSQQEAALSALQTAQQLITTLQQQLGAPK